MKEPFYDEKNSHLSVKQWELLQPKLKVGFTTRENGVSGHPYDSFNMGLHVGDRYENVISNRELLAQKLLFPLDRWVSGEQVHQTNIVIVDKSHSGMGAKNIDHSIKGIDGMITNEPGILCTAFFADCVPLYFFDPVTGYIGLAHAGWKGTVKRMAEKMLQSFVNLGSNRNDVKVVIGPCISKERYEVDDNVIDQLPLNLTDNIKVDLGNNHYLLDLKQINVEILLQNGVLRNNIEVTNYCTFNDSQLFYSHRRDGGKTGRMLGYIGYIL